MCVNKNILCTPIVFAIVCYVYIIPRILYRDLDYIQLGIFIHDATSFGVLLQRLIIRKSMAQSLFKAVYFQKINKIMLPIC